jgi:hypothetical protein
MSPSNFSSRNCNLFRHCPSNVQRPPAISVMKSVCQIFAAMTLLLLLGISGVDCFASDARMSAAEKACCQQMAGQCDMNMAAKHPCCHKIAQHHDNADLNDLSHFAAPPLSMPLALLGADSSLNMPVSPLPHPASRGKPPHDPPIPSIEILRI